MKVQVLRRLLMTLGSILGFASTGLGSPENDAKPSLFVAASLGQKSVDILSEGDIRPSARPFIFTGLELQYLPWDRWGASVSGQLGGSFFDFNGLGTSGNVEEVTWSARIGVDWVDRLTRRRALYVGLGYEYCEAKSWLKNLQVAEDGPRNVLHGGSIRAGATLPAASRLFVLVELQASAYHGHADVASLQTHYNWLGRSMGIAVGVRYRLT